MADATNAPVQPPDSGAPLPDTQNRAGFLATTTGKIVVGVVALVVLLAIAGVIIAMVAFGGIAGWLNSNGSAVVSAPGGSAVSVASSATPVPVLEPTQKPLSDSFTFRNVFAPSIKPPAPPSAETSSGTSTTGSTESPDTLYLTDIISTDEGRKAVFVWNGTTYTEGNGGVIGDSPWKVLDVGTDSVVMLYGDTQVTLTLGQGISK